jgi:hypothetical protein
MQIRLAIACRPAIFICCAAFVYSAGEARAQQPPQIGYMYPSGGQAGQTTDVVLGGYDWTPDMQVFVHDPRIKLEITGTPGPVLVPEPPYWFGKKSRRSPFLLPREFPARLTIPAEVPPGIVAWQAANANGTTARGIFLVGQFPEVMEVERGLNADLHDAQVLPALPLTINGQVKVTEDIDRYRFKAEQSGPVACLVLGRELGLDLNAIVEVRNAAGQMVAEGADTAGNNLRLTFTVEAGQEYITSIYDADFRGDRALVYRMTLAPGPSVITAIPAFGKRGETRPVRFFGMGVETGAAKLESVTREVTFPTTVDAETFLYTLETPHGTALPISLLLSDLPETMHPGALADAPVSAAQTLTLPAAVTGILRTKNGADRYTLSGMKGDVWSLEVMAKKIGSPLDVSLAIVDADGKEVARNDDANGSTDATLEFKLPTEGEFTLIVSDISGHSGEPSATYRLVAQRSLGGFTLTAPDFLNIPLGATGKLALKGVRTGGFNGPIIYSFTGLPAGVSLPAEMSVAEKKPIAPLELVVAEDAASTAALVMLTAEAKIGDRTIVRKVGPLVLNLTMTPPYAIDAEGKDDVTKWPRGTTFPGPVLIERQTGFNGEIVLEMSAKQGRVRQGIRGPELVVPPGVDRVLYPIFLPEWLETTRTSRMVVNGVAKVADPQGNLRYLSSKLATRIGFLPEGALLKLAADVTEVQHVGGQPLSIPLTISRSDKLKEAVRLELAPGDASDGGFSAEPLELSPEETQAVMTVAVGEQSPPQSECKLTLRATVLRAGEYPVVSETTVVVLFGAATSAR